MKKPSLDFVVVDSETGPGLSVRLNLGDFSATKFKSALTTAGFKPGDAVRMTRVPKARVRTGELRAEDVRR